MDGDAWMSPADLGYLVSKLLPHARNYYWSAVTIASCDDMTLDGWLSPNDVGDIVSRLLPAASDHYWVPCPQD